MWQVLPRLPCGNKEVAQKLGAKFVAGGWFAPPGVDLRVFKPKWGCSCANLTLIGKLADQSCPRSSQKRSI